MRLGVNRFCFLKTTRRAKTLLTDVFKIYGPPGTAFRTGFTTCEADKIASMTTMSTSRRGSRHGSRGGRWRSCRICRDTTGDTSRSEGGRRRVEGCLRGHDEGVSMVDEGSKTHRYDFESRDDWQCRNRPPSVVSRTFQNKRLVLSGNSKIMTLASARGIFSIPSR